MTPTRKIVLPLIIGAVVVFVAVTAIAYVLALDAASQNQNDTTKHQLTLATQMLEQELAQYKTDAIFLARSKPIVLAATGEKIAQNSATALLNEYRSLHSSVYELRIIAPDGRETLRIVNSDLGNVVANESNSEIFKRMQAVGKNTAVTSYTKNIDNGKTALYVGAAIIGSDQAGVLGYFALTLNTSYLKRRLESALHKNADILALVNSRDGSLIAVAGGQRQDPVIVDIGKRVSSNPAEVPDVSGYLISTQPSAAALLVSVVPETMIKAAAMSTANITAVLLGFSLLFFIVLTHLRLKRQIIAPLSQIAGLVGSIGEQKVNALEADHLDGEFKDLYLSIDKMKQSLEGSKKAVEKLAYFDKLTGLPNRVTLQQELAALVSHASRKKEHFAVVFMDLDNFKDVNDTLGHEFGDQLLEKAAERILANLRDSDFAMRKEITNVDSGKSIVARLGGDEFTLLLTDIEEPNTVSKIAQRILDNLCKPFQLGEHEAIVGASMGIAIYPQDGVSPANLLKNADLAMFEAKKNGKNTFEFFTKEMNSLAFQRLALEKQIREALDQQEFVLYFLPRIAVSDESLTGFEALIRWNSPELGMVVPSKFIPLAEESMLICEIGYWVFDSVCRSIQQWLDAGHSDICVSINLSPMQIYRGDTYNMLKTVMGIYGIPGKHLEIEVTEAGLIKDEKTAMAFLESIRSLGIKLALDDFGAGYSSLTQLRRLPIDMLKIDRSFFSEIDSPDHCDKMFSSIIEIANDLNLKTVAEGVENRDQLEFVRKANCDYVQGYFYSKPISMDATMEYLKDHAPQSLDN